MELRAPVAGHAMATVVEAKLDRRTGALATVVIRRGTLRVGDPVVVGTEWCARHRKSAALGHLNLLEEIVLDAGSDIM